MKGDSTLHKLFGVSPHIELTVRYLYWKFFVKYLISNKKNKTKKIICAKETSFKKIIEKLKERGIGEDDLLIVHSGMKPLKKTGLTPGEIIDELLSLVGDKGTLAMPTIPYFERNPSGADYMTKDVSDLVLKYNIEKTPAWTGIIANTFLKYDKTIRSKHPLNTMAANGPLAGAMMKKNIIGDKPAPNGIGSSWHFCSENHAKIVSIGVDLAHSLTMIHTAEDVYPDEWKIKNWYRDRKYIIEEKNKTINLTVRERHPKWAIHYGERTLSKDLLKNGIMTRDIIDGILLEIIFDSKELVDFLNSKKKTGYPYFFFKKLK